ncbi:50S ribosomal protein L28 [Alphaproteobacteria bacterium]
MVKYMSRKCMMTGKSVQFGNNVSHSNIKNRRRFLPNLKNFSLKSEILDRTINLRISTNGIRTIEHNDGLDNYLVTTPESKLPKVAIKLKREILKTLSKLEKNREVAVADVTS